MRFDRQIRLGDLVAVLALLVAIGGYFNTRASIDVAHKNAKEEFERWQKVILGIKETSDRLQTEVNSRLGFQIASMNDLTRIWTDIAAINERTTQTSASLSTMIDGVALSTIYLSSNLSVALEKVVVGDLIEAKRLQDGLRTWNACNHRMLAKRQAHSENLDRVSAEVKLKRETAKRQNLDGARLVARLDELNAILEHELAKLNKGFENEYSPMSRECAALLVPIGQPPK